MADPAHWDPRPLEEASRSTYLRLLALHQEEEEAAIVMARSDAYPDFFLESPSDQFNEYVGPPDRNISELTVRASRMVPADRLRNLAEGGGYSDLFVDSPRNGPPWHEKFGDTGPKPEYWRSPQARVEALGQSRVLQAFMRLQSSTRAERG